MTQELPKSPKPQENKKLDKNSTNPESLIIENGNLVEELFLSRCWIDIVKPVLDEMVASVSGRFTNGRYWHGGLTTKWDGNNPLFHSAYQKSLMDFHNNLHDFIVKRDKTLLEKKQKRLDKNAPLVNPFMENDDEKT